MLTCLGGRTSKNDLLYHPGCFAYIILILEYLKVKVKSLSCVRIFATPWTVACSSVHGIFQARILEWVAICFSTEYLK